VLLANELSLQKTRNGLGAEYAAGLDAARTALPAAFARLDAPRQAWILSVMAKPAPVDAITDMARKSESRLVRLACMLYHIDGKDDPMLDAARRGDDPTLHVLADRIADFLAETGSPGSGSSRPSTPARSPSTTPATVPAQPSEPPATSPAAATTTPTSP
jgi:hypothetical protein